jgi:hypothetical protein
MKGVFLTADCARSCIAVDKLLNVVVKWLTLLFRIWDVPGPNLDSKTGYPDRFSVVFLSSSRKMPE